MRLYTCSDIHTDYPENLQWVKEQPARLEDAVIVAGDVSHELGVLEETLSLFTKRFKNVFFVPGNHDLWLTRGDDIPHSDAKLQSILRLCDKLGVHTRPHRVVGAEQGLLIVPLLSWHHHRFDSEPDIVGWTGIPEAHLAMTDFQACRWHGKNQRTDSVAEYMDRLNDAETHLSEALAEYREAGVLDPEQPPPATSQAAWQQLREAAEAAGDIVISFSHFVPHIELTLEKRFLFLPTLNKAVGSLYLGERVERLRPAVHVFGHTHFGWDATLGGVRYLQAALAYPGERRQRMGSLAIGDIAHEPFLIYNGKELVAPQKCKWSDYYQTNERDPTNMELAPWVANMYTREARDTDEVDVETI